MFKLFNDQEVIGRRFPKSLVKQSIAIPGDSSEQMITGDNGDDAENDEQREDAQAASESIRNKEE